MTAISVPKPPTALARLAGDRSRLWKRTVFLVLAVITAALTLAPIAYLFWGTLTDAGTVTGDAFIRAYTKTPGVSKMITNSFIFSVGAGALSLTLGGTLAFLHVRTDVPFKPLIVISSLIPIIVPPLLYAVAWIVLANPTTGALNGMASGVGVGGRLNVYSLWGMVAVQGLILAPVAFLFMRVAFQGMDPALEEAAAASGASRLQTFRKITAPLLKPALAGSMLLMAVQAFESFEIPGLLGIPQHIFVFTSEIYSALNESADSAVAGAFAIGLLAVAVGALLLARVAEGRGSKETISGKAFRPRQVPLGTARPFVGAFVLLYFSVSVLLPMLALLYVSMLPYYRPVTMEALGSLGLQNYRELADTAGLAAATKNSLVVGALAASIVTIISAVAAWFIKREKVRGGRVLDGLLFLPMVMPGVILGLAVTFIALRIPFAIYGTIWVFVLAFSSRYLPYGSRFSAAAFGQVSVELEEAARASGAGVLQTARRILFPLVANGLLAGWIFVFVFAFKELSAAIILYSPDSQVVPVIMWRLANEGGFGALAALGIAMMLLISLVVGLVFRFAGKFGVSAVR